MERAPVAVALDGVTVVIGGRRTLGPLTLSIAAREHWAVVGPNGAGKTTLLSLAGAERHPTTGTVDVLGARLGRTDLRVLRRSIGAVGQSIADRLPRDSSAREVVLTGRDATLVTWWSEYSDNDRARADELLAFVHCAHVADQAFGRCSQGERQRVLLARSLFARHPLLVLDEPAAGVDLPGRESLIHSLDAINAEDDAPTTLHVVHTLEELPASTTHAMLLRAGEIVCAGPIGDCLTDEALSECYGIPVEVHARGGRYAATASSSW